MDSLCYDQNMYKKLLPVPKTHLFMKKMAKIQAIDRQIRKKWIKIKRDNEIQHLILTENENFEPFKKQILQSLPSANFQSNKNHCQLIKVQNQLKRQQIMNNHRRQQEVFYGRKKKHQPKTQAQNLQSPVKTQANDYLSVSFETPRKRIKTEPSIKKLTINKPKVSAFEIQKSHTSSLQKSIELKQIISLPKISKSDLKLPKMLLKRNDHKCREIKILTSQSEKQLIFLSQKNQQHLKSWAEHRRQMFDKLKGSKAYFIMKSPTKVMQTQGQQLYIV